jgi:hypothetical protein
VAVEDRTTRAELQDPGVRVKRAMRQLRNAVEKSEDSEEDGQFDHVFFAPA